MNFKIFARIKYKFNHITLLRVRPNSHVISCHDNNVNIEGNRSLKVPQYIIYIPICRRKVVALC